MTAPEQLTVLAVPDECFPDADGSQAAVLPPFGVFRALQSFMCLRYAYIIL